MDSKRPNGFGNRPGKPDATIATQLQDDGVLQQRGGGALL
jgi:hypothetical protein